MGEATKIEWCDHTFNPWIGCTEVSPACDHCYARTMAHRRKWAEWGVGKPRHRTSPANWRAPLAWNRAAERAGERRRVFCASLADVFDAEVPEAWRRELFDVIGVTPQLDWLLLTKRPAVAVTWFARHRAPANVRIGTTVENQEMALARLPHLQRLAQAGLPTFVSYEPALSAVKWLPWLKDGTIGWLIAGGESGAQARPPHPEWFREARDVCARFKVPFLFKQWGDWLPLELVDDEEAEEPWRHSPHGHATYVHGEHGRPRAEVDHVKFERLGKKEAGALLDGREWREFP